MPDQKPLLLIVDDDPLLGESLAFALADTFDVHLVTSRPACRMELEWLPRPPDLALVDLGLPPAPHRPGEGFALIRELLTRQPQLRILVLSGQDEQENARHARTLGALEFIPKPCEPSQLRQLLLKVLDSPPDAHADASPLAGHSPAMEKLRQQIALCADSPYPVLITGESGCGKEVVAQWGLHRQTRRRQQPFLAVNCAALAPSLMEATLFGHTRGAYTGAHEAQAGYFEDAGEGTLFLDEIGELPLELQPKLLRVLENGEYQRLGETHSRRARARIIAATNRDLRQAVREGRFRADLYHRLSVFTLEVPPLRDMGADRLVLFTHFCEQLAAQLGLAPPSLDSDAQARWLAYPFPGNVRELRNIVLRLITRYPGQALTPAQLLPELEQDEEAPLPASHLTDPADAEQLLLAASQHLAQAAPINLDATLNHWGRAYLEAALRRSQGNVSQAARLLGLSRSTFYNRLEAWSRD
ncbi:MAG: sigma-54 dependent transcriptional regulator [Azovibrio sp.]|nr:sigma-54 dependent transcriptional regulator [Azovibrio sp.]